jgi:hypothetical protein
MTKDFCDSVITIPQINGTCWFNALMMMFFYSQNSRKLLLYYKPFKGKTDVLSKTLKSILYKNYKLDKKTIEFFNQNNIDSILKECSRFEAYSKKQASVGLPHYRTEEGPQKRRWRDAQSLESLKRSLVALGENITDVDLKNWYNAQYLACLTNRSHIA